MFVTNEKVIYENTGTLMFEVHMKSLQKYAFKNQFQKKKVFEKTNDGTHSFLQRKTTETNHDFVFHV